MVCLTLYSNGHYVETVPLIYSFMKPLINLLKKSLLHLFNLYVAGVRRLWWGGWQCATVYVSTPLLMRSVLRACVITAPPSSPHTGYVDAIRYLTDERTIPHSTLLYTFLVLLLNWQTHTHTEAVPNHISPHSVPLFSSTYFILSDTDRMTSHRRTSATWLHHCCMPCSRPRPAILFMLPSNSSVRMLFSSTSLSLMLRSVNQSLTLIFTFRGVSMKCKWKC